MISLKIDTIEVSVPEGTTILQAAAQEGIKIPSMCYNKSVENHPSCMVCVVKNIDKNEIIPSCAYRVEPGMNISCNASDVLELRKEALELLLSDHVGDCEAPCRNACPAFMDIPKMNRLIAHNRFDEAIKVVKEEIAIPLILGYICSAPCEKVCRRNQADESVSICQLKKFVALTDSNKSTFYLPNKKSNNKKIAIIGAGPSGLACAYHLTIEGYSCEVFDKNDKVGGTLLQIEETVLPKEILEAEIKILQESGIIFKLNNLVTKDLLNQMLTHYDSIVIANGEPTELIVENEKIFVCGSAAKKTDMAVKAVAQGKFAALHVNDYLQGNKASNLGKRLNSKFGKLADNEVIEYLIEASADSKIDFSKSELAGFTPDEAIKEAQRCMRCDCRKSANCKLRNYAHEYNAAQRKYKFGKRKVIRKHFQYEILVYEPEKCIKCGLCIKITSRYKEKLGLTYIGRGFNMSIQTPFNSPIQDAITVSAAECIEACPTAALSFIDKNNHY